MSNSNPGGIPKSTITILAVPVMRLLIVAAAEAKSPSANRVLL